MVALVAVMYVDHRTKTFMNIVGLHNVHSICSNFCGHYQSPTKHKCEMVTQVEVSSIVVGTS